MSTTTVTTTVTKRQSKVKGIKFTEEVIEADCEGKSGQEWRKQQKSEKDGRAAQAV